MVGTAQNFDAVVVGAGFSGAGSKNRLEARRKRRLAGVTAC
jgi:cation diffusion facilitator CzcD-associated flavoprotein CzcO